MLIKEDRLRLLRRKNSQNGGRSKRWLEESNLMGRYVILLLGVYSVHVRLKEREMDRHVARMGNRILVEQHDSERPSGGFSVLVIIILKCVIMK
jgi:hypothetical protein